MAERRWWRKAQDEEGGGEASSARRHVISFTDDGEGLGNDEREEINPSQLAITSAKRTGLIVRGLQFRSNRILPLDLPPGK